MLESDLDKKHQVFIKEYDELYAELCKAIRERDFDKSSELTAQIHRKVKSFRKENNAAVSAALQDFKNT